MTSDRGLCGAIHSGVAKTIKSEIANLTSAGKEVMVVNVGDKLRGLLHRCDVATNSAVGRGGGLDWISSIHVGVNPNIACVTASSFRTHGQHIILNCKEIGRKPPSFGDASIVATELLNSGFEFDQGSVIYNRFR